MLTVAGCIVLVFVGLVLFARAVFVPSGRPAPRPVLVALPLDDGPLDLVAGESPTLDQLFGHAHRSDLLDATRDRLRSAPPFEPGVRRGA
jgi:hypothetical protein